MNLTRDRLRSIGWVSLLSVCTALTAGLTLRVNAVKSEVHQTEARIVRIRHEIAFLETEYQTRSNQHQLSSLNDVEFGYTAPRAQQYIEGERQLAALGVPRGPGAPAQLRVAAAPSDAELAAIVPMVSPVTGKSQGASAAGQTAKHPATAGQGGRRNDNTSDPIASAIDAETLGNRLSRSGPLAADR